MPDSLLQQPLLAPVGLRTRWRDRRRLHRVDRLGARLARLDAVDAVLARAHDRLASGWVQDAWFTTIDDEGVQLHVGTLRAHDGERSERACLVAAVAIESLPGTITGPVAQRAIGTMWNVLHGGGVSSDWGTPPGVTAARAYDLVRWNDATDRRQTDVLALVSASRASLAHTTTAVRTELTNASA
ncbi:hypothetical protein GCM10025783_19830 [Amnibacterium soli]|uniref:Uncharacterized protein n=1 Tax=Amnibacterium soli TaxID=1282736 RepID=A0ABP8Z6U9_9MICO